MHALERAKKHITIHHVKSLSVHHEKTYKSKMFRPVNQKYDLRNTLTAL